jgi:DNA-binding NarL/FixJ family response regulator
MKPRNPMVDDHEIVREGVRRNLLTKSRTLWDICGEAVRDSRVVILDVMMPGLSGLEAATHLHKLGPGCRELRFHDA